MKRAISLFALLLLVLTGCRDSSPSLTKTLDLGSFRLKVPENWQSVPEQGIDSQVGRITNGQDALAYDFGGYSYNLRDEASATHVRTATTIGGRPALIVRPREKGKGVIGLYVEVGTMNRLVLTGRNIRDEATVLKIFESVAF